MPDINDAQHHHDTVQAAVDKAIALMEESNEAALESRRGALESMLSAYDSSIHSLSVIQQSPDFTEHHQKREKAHLVALEAQCVMLAQELDGPEREYAHRLREITQRRKELLGY